MTKPIRHLGLISDTHGLLREEAVRALRGSDLILHAGDVGAAEILEALKEIAPVIAVRGNVDQGEWAQRLAITEVVEAGSATIYMLHILQELDVDPRAAGLSIVVSGHSHKPEQTERDGVLYISRQCRAAKISVARGSGPAGFGGQTMEGAVYRSCRDEAKALRLNST